MSVSIRTLAHGDKNTITDRYRSLSKNQHEYQDDSDEQEDIEAIEIYEGKLNNNDRNDNITPLKHMMQDSNNTQSRVTENNANMSNTRPQTTNSYMRVNSHDKFVLTNQFFSGKISDYGDTNNLRESGG